ncbi:MAG TPA: hypothetical protein VN857_17880 [Chthoniobacterales bacterium]|nr:hypothetical protein [Chthoniobacterales bacterium]
MKKPATPGFFFWSSRLLLWLWLYRLNFAAPQLVATLFQPNGLFALFAAISRGDPFQKARKPIIECVMTGLFCREHVVISHAPGSRLSGLRPLPSWRLRPDYSEGKFLKLS